MYPSIKSSLDDFSSAPILVLFISDVEDNYSNSHDATFHWTQNYISTREYLSFNKLAILWLHHHTIGEKGNT